MSTDTTIEWATKTWGPVLGCKKVSAGCDNCYAIRTSHRLAANPNPKVRDAYEDLTEHTETGLDWTGVVRTLPERLADPLRWRKPERIFVNSQSDLFHPAVGADFTARVFATMARTPQHTYQVLTKRPDVALKVLGDPAFEAMVGAFSDEAAPGEKPLLVPLFWPLPNVWIGVSVEDQKSADERIPKLLQIPSAVRWISAEPLLGPIDMHGPIDQFGGRPRLNYWLPPGRPYFPPGEPGSLLSGSITSAPSLDWVVVGGESGPGARPMHPDWARSLRDQCAAAGVPMLLKQRGAWTWTSRPTDPWGQRDPDLWVEESSGRIADEATAVAARGSWYGVYRVGKKAAGRELDGVVHDAYPARTAVAR